MHKNKELSSILRLLSFMGREKYVFITLSLSSALVFTANKILMGLANKNLINSAVEKNYSLFYTAAWFAVIAFILLVMIDPVIRYIKDIIAIKAMSSFRLKLFSHIERLPVGYFSKNLSGDLVSRLNDDLNKVNQIWYNQLRALLVSFFHGIGSAITILIIDWRLCIVIIIMGVLSTKLNTVFAKAIHKSSESIQKNTGLTTQIVVDIINGARVIKMFNMENSIIKKYKQFVDAGAMHSIEKNSISAGMDSINFLLSIFNLLGVLIIGLYMVSVKLTDIGSVMAIVTLQGGITSMFSGLGSWLSRMQVSLASGRRIFEILDCEEEPRNDAASDFETNEIVHGELMIEFKEVCFGYQEGLVLKDFNLRIRRNKAIALVGSSGGGKSTIIKLLLGYYIPLKGSIHINGMEVKDYKLKQLRKMISYVPQSPYLFDGTIKENILYGKVDATEEEVIYAAKAAYAHEFIVNMESGYDTEVGEGGSKLSGGQKQRIALARAILKAAPILILDEATSALDSESEALVQKALSELTKRCTSIIIAHRLSTIKAVDKICVVADGNIAEEGTHDELLKGNSKYYSLYNSYLA